MKLDQETIVKHQFWFLLGGYFLVWLVAVFWLWGVAGSQIDTARKKFKDANDGVKNAQGSAVNTTKFLPPWKEEFEKLNTHKVDIWKTAWDYQAGMYDWPKEWIEKYNGMPSPQVQISTDDLSNYRDKLYPAQVINLRKYAPLWIDPVELKDGFDRVFKPMTTEEWKENPTREECWLAQEDIWVKRELFYIIYDALARQAIMNPVPIDDKQPKLEGVEARYRFANKNWEITLNLRKNKDGFLVIGGDSTIKNIHPSHQSQPLTSAKGGGVWFNIAQGNVATKFEVGGEPVSWNDTQAFSMDKDGNRSDYAPLDAIAWDAEKLKANPVVVSQGFDLTNSPIRRLNAIQLDKQDCRTFTWPLQPNHTLAQLDAAAEDAAKKAAPATQASGQGAGGGAPGGGQDMQAQMQRAQQQQQMQSMGGGRPGFGGGGQSAGPKNATPNNDMDRDRYLQPASQDKKLDPPSRHLPLAIQLIVEQSHMHDVLMSLANSRLRFQTTQVEYRHVKDYKPQSEGDKKEGADTAAPGKGTFAGPVPGMPGGGMYGGGMQQRMQQQQLQRQQQMQGMQGGMQQRMQQQQARMQQQQQMMGGTGFGPMMNPNQGMKGGITAPTLKNRQSPTATAQPTKEAEKEPDDNLVEMTIYGIAILYRMPDALLKKEQPSSSASPSQQQPGQQNPSAAPSTPPPPAAAAKQQSGKEAKQPTATPPAAKQSEKQPKQPAPPPKTGGKG